ncbi:MAG: hypothetical protein ER33_10900 [Cyanobium sp. CACIAM 14]|nr:MAG: hypothetical protein ER33_10900 [Cyanobium sp. CACIAM 14]
MGHPVGFTAGHARSASLAQRFGEWLAETINHAWGNPAEEALHRPPAIGVQPFSGDTRRRRR